MYKINDFLGNLQRACNKYSQDFIYSLRMASNLLKVNGLFLAKIPATNFDSIDKSKPTKAIIVTLRQQQYQVCTTTNIRVAGEPRVVSSAEQGAQMAVIIQYRVLMAASVININTSCIYISLRLC